MFPDILFDARGPALTIQVLANPFAQHGGKVDFAGYFRFYKLPNRYTAQAINDLKQTTVGTSVFVKTLVSLLRFFERTTQNRAEVHQGQFALVVVDAATRLHNRFQFLPFAGAAPPFLKGIPPDFIGFHKHERQVGKNVVDFATAIGYFNHHLLIVDAKAVPATFGRHQYREV